jgi:four helix bundle suffix protein
LLDYQDYLRQKDLPLWPKAHAEAKSIRALAWKKNRSYKTYKIYIEDSNPEVAANTMISMIHQAIYLLDQQLQSLEKDFLEQGGFTERLYRKRTGYRKRKKR